MRRLAAALALLLAAAAPALAQSRPEPPAQPFLRIDPGFHTQVVNRVASDAEARIAATVSDDKTIRLWSIADGRALATLRVPIADEDQEGELYAVALSPDGATLLAAGHTGWVWDKTFCLYLFDVANQRLRGRLPGLQAAVNDIAYSPDGRRFAIALGGRAGIRVHDAATGQLQFADTEFADRATAVAFAPDGRLAATGFDGAVRLYGADGKRIARREMKGTRPYGLAFSRDGGQLAVGVFDEPRVELLAGRDLKTVRTLRVERVGGGLGAVAWTTQGRLLAGGSVRDGQGRVVVVTWAPGLRGQPDGWPVARDTIADLLPLPDGGALVASADPALVRIAADGQSLGGHDALTFDLREVGERRLALSADGTILDIHPKDAEAPLRIDLGQRTVGPASGPLPVRRTLVPVPVEPLRVANWRNEQRPTVNGKPVGLETEEISRSHAITAGQTFALLGTDYYLRVYRADGTLAGRVRTPGTVWGVTVSPDARTVVAALGDGTVRWYGLDINGTLEERIALLLARDGQRWIAWTSEGFFDHSDLGGKELVGYHLNRGRGELADWVSFAQVYRLFYAPDIVLARQRGGSPAEAQQRLAEIGDLRQRLASGGAPRIEIVDLCWGVAAQETCGAIAKGVVTRTLIPIAASAAPAPAPPAQPAVDLRVPAGTEEVRIRFRLVDQGGGVGPVDLFLGGRNAGRIDAPEVADPTATTTMSVAIEPGVSRLQLRAYDRRGATYAQSRSLLVAADRAPAPVAAVPRDIDERPRLWLVAAAVDRYQPEIVSLNFAVADAKAFTGAIKERASKLYKSVETIELYDDAATTETIVAALGKVAGSAAQRDTFLLYLAGHGTIVDQRYYFVPQNVKSSRTVPQEALSDEAVVKAVAAIRAKNGMVFLDTCHAGAVGLVGAGQLAHESGRYLLAAATSVEEALDSYDNQNGVFATAVLRGVAGEAARGGSPVTNFDLGLYVKDTVGKLAKEKNHRQRAQFKVASDDAEAFPIAAPR